MSSNWSSEYPFTKESIMENAPESAGVYEIFQSDSYSCYDGNSRIIEIGKSGSNLKKELLNHLNRHTVSNRLARIKQKPGIKISFICQTIGSGDVSSTEGDLLRKFEDKHWQLPILNSQRGYGRREDKHYR